MLFLLNLFARKPKTEIVLFAGLEGVICFRGEPAKGAEVKLVVKWDPVKPETCSVVTDERGWFSLERKTSFYRPTPLARTMVSQRVTVNYYEQEFLIWSLTSSDGILPVDNLFEKNTITCELTDEIKQYSCGRLGVNTNCQWSEMPKAEDF